MSSTCMNSGTAILRESTNLSWTWRFGKACWLPILLCLLFCFTSMLTSFKQWFLLLFIAFASAFLTFWLYCIPLRGHPRLAVWLVPSRARSDLHHFIIHSLCKKSFRFTGILFVCKVLHFSRAWSCEDSFMVSANNRFVFCLPVSLSGMFSESCVTTTKISEKCS